MKKLIILSSIVAFIFLQSCSETEKQELVENKAKTEKQEKAVVKAEVVSHNSFETNSKTENVKGTKMLTKQDFLAKVMNYEENPTEWKFEGNKPCLIDFYADWCGPCKIAAPILEELAAEYDGKIDIYKIDVQKERELAGLFGVQSIPAFLLCTMEGKPQMSNGIGRSPEETKKMFKQMIDDFLLKKGA